MKSRALGLGGGAKKKGFMTEPDLDNANLDKLMKICQQLFDKWYSLEGEMFFLQREVILRDRTIKKLSITVRDMKEKFTKEAKKVSKYENKSSKLQKKAAKFAFANQPKQKAAREMKKEQVRMAEGNLRVIAEPMLKEEVMMAEERLQVVRSFFHTMLNLRTATQDELKKIVKFCIGMCHNLEREKIFLQRKVIHRDIQISVMKEKLIKEAKKVSKYEDKLAKIQEKAAKANQLKQSE